MFNMDDYEDVHKRVRRFKDFYPDGRIGAWPLYMNLDAADPWVIIIGYCYYSHDDLYPAGVDIALGRPSFYRDNMKRWFMEDTATSAIGRAIALAIETKTKATKQNMEQVLPTPQPKVESSDPWAVVEKPAPMAEAVDVLARELGAQVVTVPSCKHGEMNYKSGISAKTGRPYSGYTCPSKDRNDQCDARWNK
jgi:hypothetical protein